MIIVNHPNHKINRIETLIAPLIKINYSISIAYNDWRYERYIPLAAKITAWQIFFSLTIVSLLLLPPVKSKDEMLWASGTIIFWMIVCFYVVERKIIRLIYRMRLSYSMSRKKNLLPLQIKGILVTTPMFAVFLLMVILKIYEYHTRFFWWNH